MIHQFTLNWSFDYGMSTIGRYKSKVEFNKNVNSSGLAQFDRVLQNDIVALVMVFSETIGSHIHLNLFNLYSAW